MHVLAWSMNCRIRIKRASFARRTNSTHGTEVKNKHVEVGRLLYTQAAESKQSHFHLQLLCTKKWRRRGAGRGWCHKPCMQGHWASLQCRQLCIWAPAVWLELWEIVGVFVEKKHAASPRQGGNIDAIGASYARPPQIPPHLHTSALNVLFFSHQEVLSKWLVWVSVFLVLWELGGGFCLLFSAWRRWK